MSSVLNLFGAKSVTSHIKLSVSVNNVIFMQRCHKHINPSIPLAETFETDYINTRVFGTKSNIELLRSLFVLKASSVDILVKYSEKVGQIC